MESINYYRRVCVIFRAERRYKNRWGRNSFIFFFKLNHRGALRAACASVYFAARKMYDERELIESLNAARSRFKLSMKLSNFNGEIITWEITVRASLCRRVIWGAVVSELLENFWSKGQQSCARRERERGKRWCGWQRSKRREFSVIIWSWMGSD